MILSVSRRTDIPNYYSDWFYQRVLEGFLYVRNPMNAHQISRIEINPEVVDCIAFWSKNPEPMMKRLGELKPYRYFFHFTMNGYGKEIEQGVPELKQRIVTFRKLAELIGAERMIWRYDPIFFSAVYTPEFHLEMFARIAEALQGSTGRVFISFIDWYAATKRRMKDMRPYHPEDTFLHQMSAGMSEIAGKNQMEIITCAEPIDLSGEGISHGACFDQQWIEEHILGYRIKASKSNDGRTACGCIEFMETGTYDTCMNNCVYCYANRSNEGGAESMKRFDVNSPLLCGSISWDDKITERKVKRLGQEQISLFENLCPDGASK